MPASRPSPALVLVGLLGLLAVRDRPAPAAPATAPRPNLIFLLSDDQRWNSLGCMGDPVLQTPNLDRMAHEGVLFTHTCVSTSICCVSRASMLTGQYAARHHIHDFATPLTPAQLEQTYPVLMRKNGYYTGFIGKYGVGSKVPDAFDFNRATPQLTNQWVKDAQGRRVHVITQDTGYALDFLRERPKDRPFCLSLSYRAPHAEDKNPEQYLPLPEDASLYQDATIPVPPTASQHSFELLPPFLQTEKNFGRVRWHWRFDTSERYQQYVKNYYRLITEIDRSAGQIREELKREGVEGDTVLVFAGDNGYFLGEHGLADKWYPYEESIRVPLVVFDPRLPRSRRGQRVDDLVLNVDYAPTFLSLTGCPIPAGTQGRDFSPLYRGPRPKEWRTEFYYDHIVPIDGIEDCEALVTLRYKYILWPHHNYEELFDLKRDPHEERDLTRDGKHERLLAELRARFQDRKRDVYAGVNR